MTFGDKKGYFVKICGKQVKQFVNSILIIENIFCDNSVQFNHIYIYYVQDWCYSTTMMPRALITYKICYWRRKISPSLNTLYINSKHPHQNKPHIWKQNIYLTQICYYIINNPHMTIFKSINLLPFPLNRLQQHCISSDIPQN